MHDLTAARTAPALVATEEVHVLPPARRFVLRGDSAARAAAERALGVAIPAAACRAETAAGRSALWLGPDEWLLLAAADDVAADVALEAALAGLAHSLVDVSHRQVALAVRGPLAATLLASGCPLDLDPKAFPVGMCTRTVLGKAEVVLWRTGTERFRLDIARSFAPYVWACLEEARREFL